MSDRLVKILVITYFLILWIGIATFLFTALVVNANAHTWYTDKFDPVSKISCCGGIDCAPIPAESVRETSGGYIYLPTGEFIPASRVQPAHDWHFHRCVFQFDNPAGLKGTTRCFFAPPGAM